jgi:hypothetical protein
MVLVAMKPVPPVTRAVSYLDAILKNNILGVKVLDQFLKAECIKSCGSTVKDCKKCSFYPPASTVLGSFGSPDVQI